MLTISHVISCRHCFFLFRWYVNFCTLLQYNYVLFFLYISFLCTCLPGGETSLLVSLSNIHKRQTAMPPVGFEPEIPKSERPWTARPPGRAYFDTTVLNYMFNVYASITNINTTATLPIQYMVFHKRLARCKA